MLDIILFETYYPGQGHTADNIVIWFIKEKILYGGCLIKGADAESLGYLGDANKKEYESTLKKVQAKYRKPKFIIISHSDWDNIKSLKHSIMLAKELKKKLKLKVDGEEYEEEIDFNDDENLRKHLQKSKAFDKRAKEFTGYKSQVEQLLKMLEEDPEALLEKMGKDYWHFL